MRLLILTILLDSSLDLLNSGLDVFVMWPSSFFSLRRHLCPWQHRLLCSHQHLQQRQLQLPWLLSRSITAPPLCRLSVACQLCKLPWRQTSPLRRQCHLYLNNTRRCELRRPWQPCWALMRSIAKTTHQSARKRWKMEMRPMLKGKKRARTIHHYLACCTSVSELIQDVVRMLLVLSLSHRIDLRALGNDGQVTMSCLFGYIIDDLTVHRISPVIGRTFLHEQSQSHVKNGVRLTIKMFVESTVRHAIVYILQTKSCVKMSSSVRLIIKCDLYLGKYGSSFPSQCAEERSVRNSFEYMSYLHAFKFVCIKRDATAIRVFTREWYRRYTAPWHCACNVTLCFYPFFIVLDLQTEDLLLPRVATCLSEPDIEAAAHAPERREPRFRQKLFKSSRIGCQWITM